MLQQETTTIKGSTYMATQLPAPKGMALLEWLMRKIGPGLEVMFDDPKAAEEGQANQSGLFKGLGAIFKELSGNDLEYLYNELAPHCTANGVGMDKSEVRSMHFAGKYGEYLEWLIWILQVNFKSFFVGLGTLKEVTTEQGFPTASTSQSQTE